MPSSILDRITCQFLTSNQLASFINSDFSNYFSNRYRILLVSTRELLKNFNYRSNEEKDENRIKFLVNADAGKLNGVRVGVALDLSNAIKRPKHNIKLKLTKEGKITTQEAEYLFHTKIHPVSKVETPVVQEMAERLKELMNNEKISSFESNVKKFIDEQIALGEDARRLYIPAELSTLPFSIRYDGELKDKGCLVVSAFDKSETNLGLILELLNTICSDCDLFEKIKSGKIEYLFMNDKNKTDIKDFPSKMLASLRNIKTYLDNKTVNNDKISFIYYSKITLSNQISKVIKKVEDGLNRQVVSLSKADEVKEILSKQNINFAKLNKIFGGMDESTMIDVLKSQDKDQLERYLSSTSSALKKDKAEIRKKLNMLEPQKATSVYIHISSRCLHFS